MLPYSGVWITRSGKNTHATRGSFYWHFKDRDDQLKALLHDWEVANYVAIANIRARWARSRPDLTELIEFWIAEGPDSPAFGMAIRTWARADSDVEEVMHRVDNDWINLVQLLFEPEGYEDAERLVRARIVYFHQVGYHALALREQRSERLRLVPYYYKVLTGREPGDSLRSVLRAFQRNEEDKSTTKRKPHGTVRKAERSSVQHRTPKAAATRERSSGSRKST
jgi:AcrR family transcriptional regulator